MTWNGSELIVYKNGVGASISMQFPNNTLIRTLNTGGYSMQIGRRITNPGFARIDWVDDIRMWDRVLTQVHKQIPLNI